MCKQPASLPQEDFFGAIRRIAAQPAQPAQPPPAPPPVDPMMDDVKRITIERLRHPSIIADSALPGRWHLTDGR